MDQCMREKESLYHLEMELAENIKRSFDSMDDEVDSYFVPYEEKDYLTEYDFETLPQLKELMARLWKDEADIDGVLKTVLAASMKNKPSGQDNIFKRKNVDDAMPVFTYTF